MARPSKRPRKARGRPRAFDRDAALHRAMELFWRQGYESTSISDLTSAMGITAPSLYAAFGAKERLYLEAVERYKSGLGDSGSILAGEATARGAIRSEEHTSELQSPCNLVCRLLLEKKTGTGRIPTRRSRWTLQQYRRQ